MKKFLFKKIPEGQLFPLAHLIGYATHRKVAAAAASSLIKLF